MVCSMKQRRDGKMKKLNPTIRMNLSKAQIKRYKDIILSARFTRACPMPYNLTTWNTMKCPHCGGLNWSARAMENPERRQLSAPFGKIDLV